MTEFKTNNDGYCAYCGKMTRLHQPHDFKEKCKSVKWLCSKCLKSKFGIDITKDKTTWGEMLYI